MKIKEPVFEEQAMTAIDGRSFADWWAEAAKNEEAADVQLERVDAPELDGERMEWKRGRVIGGRLPGLRATGGYFADVLFRDCDLSGAVFRDAGFSGVRFERCRLTGANFFGASLRDVVVDQAAGQYCLFTKARFKSVAFVDCKWVQANLDEIAWKDWSLSGCDLTGANFLHTAMAGLDLRDCDIADIMCTGQELKGTVVTSLQACDLAKLLGVVIRD